MSRSRGPTVPVAVLGWDGEVRRRRSDRLATEEPMEIRLVHGPRGARLARPVSITMRTPGDDVALALGFLFAEGIIVDRGSVEQVRHCPGEGAQRFNVVEVVLAPDAPVDEERLLRHFYLSSSCGVCGKASLEAVERLGCDPLPADGFEIAAERVAGLPDRLAEAQPLFARTGGLHAAGLFDAAGLLLVAKEDVGRHNAVDKVVGERWMAGLLPLARTVLVLSGRASFEILQKAVVAAVPVVVAVGAPSSLAVDLARRFRVTLVGFARGAAFNVYTGEERVR